MKRQDIWVMLTYRAMNLQLLVSILAKSHYEPCQAALQFRSKAWVLLAGMTETTAMSHTRLGWHEVCG